MRRYILVLDAGTTYIKAFVLDEAFAVVAGFRKELRTLAPRCNWIEQDAGDYFQRSVEACRRAVQAAGIPWSEIAALSITNQRSTLVVWNAKTGEPLRNAITWQDSRAADIFREVYSGERFGEYIQRTGRRAALFTPGTGLAWIRRNEPEVWNKLSTGEALFGTVDAYLVHRLTGGATYATSFSNVGTYCIYDCRDGEWYGELMDRFGINVPGLRFPQVRDETVSYGTTSPALFPEQLPITCVIADQQSEMFANMVREEGVSKCTLSTGVFVGINAGETLQAAPEGLTNQNGWRIDGETSFFFEGMGGMAGSMQQWIKEELGLFQEYHEIDEMAESVEDSGGVIFIPTLAGILAPIWDASARGTVFGLNRGTTKAHLLRAMLEGIAFRVKDILVCAQQRTGVEMRLVRVGGGLSKSEIFCRILTDLLGVPCERTRLEDPSVYGAALLGAYGAGLVSKNELYNRSLDVTRYEPRMPERRREAHYALWCEGVRRSLDWPDLESLQGE